MSIATRVYPPGGHWSPFGGMFTEAGNAYRTTADPRVWQVHLFVCDRCVGWFDAVVDDFGNLVKVSP